MNPRLPLGIVSDVTNIVEVVLREAGVNRWCTKMVCTTCGAPEFRHAIGRAKADLSQFVTALAAMDLAAWYDVENLGGAVATVFHAIPDMAQRSHVLSSWRPRIAGHTRLIDAVIFGVIRPHLSVDLERAEWLSLARAEALLSQDPSLLETLVYTLGRLLMNDSALLNAALDRRRGYAPLHRAIDKTLGHLAAEA